MHWKCLKINELVRKIATEVFQIRCETQKRQFKKRLHQFLDVFLNVSFKKTWCCFWSFKVPYLKFIYRKTEVFPAMQTILAKKCHFPSKFRHRVSLRSLCDFLSNWYTTLGIGNFTFLKTLTCLFQKAHIKKLEFSRWKFIHSKFLTIQMLRWRTHARKPKHNHQTSFHSVQLWKYRKHFHTSYWPLSHVTSQKKSFPFKYFSIENRPGGHFLQQIVPLSFLPCLWKYYPRTQTVFEIKTFKEDFQDVSQKLFKKWFATIFWSVETFLRIFLLKK